MSRRPLTLAAFLADLPAPLAAFLAARFTVRPGNHWLWTGSHSTGAGVTGGGRGRPKCGITVQTPDGPVRFWLPYRLTLYLRFGAPLPGYRTALHKCKYNNRHVGFCCTPDSRHVIYGPDCENEQDRRLARKAGAAA